MIITLVAVIVLAVGVAAAFYFKKPDAQVADGGTTMVLDSNAVEGGIEGKSLQEMVDEMQEKTDKGSIIVNFANDMVFPDGTSDGDIKLGNPVENIYPMQFIVSLTETGDVVYESDLIPVGSHIKTFKLAKDLDKGVYPAILTYKAYDEEAKEFVSHVSVAVTITVQS